MDVQVDDGITRGMSVVDKLGVVHDARNRAAWCDVLERGRKHTVIWEMDIPGWKQSLLQALR
jgi:inosine-uridine nucleoside N-ribohydrolase